MSHREKLEQVADLLINEEQEKAEELLHQIMVEMARSAYESILEDDMKASFADEIEADQDEVDADEIGADVDDQVEVEDEYEANDDVEVEVEDDFDMGNQEEDDDADLEDRVEDLEKLLADLTAMVDMQVSDDEVFDGDVDMETDTDDELEEGTKFQNQVKVSMSKEGQLAGTGKNSQAGPTGTEAPYTHAPKKTNTEGKPTDFAGGDEKGMKAPKGKSHTPTSNVDVKQAKAPAVKQKEEGNVNTDSLLAN